MRVCDGVICSTEYLARRYRRFNPRTWVCRTRSTCRATTSPAPRRDGVTIGWAGGTGHARRCEPWLPGVRGRDGRAPETRFVTIGEPFAGDFAEDASAPSAASRVPFAQLETYPAAMTMFDVALAPSARTTFFRGKSDLRWLEASALGIPLVADPGVYPEIEHGVTGFHAATPDEMRAHPARRSSTTPGCAPASARRRTSTSPRTAPWRCGSGLGGRSARGCGTSLKSGRARPMIRACKERQGVAPAP